MKEIIEDLPIKNIVKIAVVYNVVMIILTLIVIGG